jgi:hypothetical protein
VFPVRIGRDAGMSEHPYKVEQWSKGFAGVTKLILEAAHPTTLTPNLRAS